VEEIKMLKLKLTEKEILDYLEDKIKFWRRERSDLFEGNRKPEVIELEYIQNHIDTFQAVRKALFGRRLRG